jgi:CheY-like chemotaxis protein
MLEARSDEVHVLFTDIDMPGSMDGLRLAENVHARWPHIALLVSSGYQRPHPHQIPDNGQVLAKPYHADELAQHIREQLGRH